MDTTKLWKRLNETLNIAFSVGGEAAELPAVSGLTIEGIGEVALPLSENEVIKRVLIGPVQTSSVWKGDGNVGRYYRPKYMAAGTYSFLIRPSGLPGMRTTAPALTCR